MFYTTYKKEMDRLMTKDEFVLELRDQVYFSENPYSAPEMKEYAHRFMDSARKQFGKEPKDILSEHGVECKKIN